MIVVTCMKDGKNRIVGFTVNRDDASDLILTHLIQRVRYLAGEARAINMHAAPEGPGIWVKTSESTELTYSLMHRTSCIKQAGGSWFTSATIEVAYEDVEQERYHVAEFNEHELLPGSIVPAAPPLAGVVDRGVIDKGFVDEGAVVGECGVGGGGVVGGAVSGDGCGEGGVEGGGIDRANTRRCAPQVGLVPYMTQLRQALAMRADALAARVDDNVSAETQEADCYEEAIASDDEDDDLIWIANCDDEVD